MDGGSYTRTMKYRTPINFHVVLLLVLTLAIFSCRKESPVIVPEDVVELRFKIGVPASSRPGINTYSINASDESTINSLILLVFKVDGGVETLSYYKQGMQIYSGPSANEKSFFANLVKSGDTFRFVLIVNSGEQARNIMSLVPLETEKSIVMEQLVYTLTDKWNATSSSDYTPLPMWGESEEVLGVNAQTVLPQIDLVRSLARVDIKLSGNAASNFIIESLHVLNTGDKIRIAPAPENFDVVNKLVTAPSIPAGGTLPVLHYTLSPPSNSFEREIYLPEAEAGEVEVIIGGSYNGNPKSYYRADFKNSADNPIPLLRNHRYIINIVDVTGNGLEPDPTMNFVKRPSIMEKTNRRINMNVSEFDQ